MENENMKNVENKDMISMEAIGGEVVQTQYVERDELAKALQAVDERIDKLQREDEDSGNEEQPKDEGEADGNEEQPKDEGEADGNEEQPEDEEMTAAAQLESYFGSIDIGIEVARKLHSYDELFSLYAFHWRRKLVELIKSNADPRFLGTIKLLQMIDDLIRERKLHAALGMLECFQSQLFWNQEGLDDANASAMRIVNVILAHMRRARNALSQIQQDSLNAECRIVVERMEAVQGLLTRIANKP